MPFCISQNADTQVTAATGRHAKPSPAARYSPSCKQPQTLTSMHAVGTGGEYRVSVFVKCETATAAGAAAEIVRGRKSHKIFQRCQELMQQASWRNLWVTVFCEMRNSDHLNPPRPPEIVCCQVRCRLQSLGTYVFCSWWLYSGSPLLGECMHTVGDNRLPWPPHTPLTASEHDTVMDFMDSFNFVVYNDSIKVWFVYFHVCYTPFQSCRPFCLHQHIFECGKGHCLKKCMS